MDENQVALNQKEIYYENVRVIQTKKKNNDLKILGDQAMIVKKCEKCEIITCVFPYFFVKGGKMKPKEYPQIANEISKIAK